MTLTDYQEGIAQGLIRNLQRLGYSGDLLHESYRLVDWFQPGQVARQLRAAAFAQTPPAYDSACVAVVAANGSSGPELINQFRSLGAPVALEILQDRVIQWRVTPNVTDSDRLAEFLPHEMDAFFEEKKVTWKPRNVLRAKNIGRTEPQQLDFVDIGLIPALEHHVREKLSPLLKSVLYDAQQAHIQTMKRPLDYDRLYRLAFRALAGKVMHDRGVHPFSSMTGESEAEEIIERVARHYGDSEPIYSHATIQRLVVGRLWSSFDFANLSVEALAFTWENTLLSEDDRAENGIHATPPSIARYMVNRLPIEEVAEGDRRVVEPCCGSGTFLIAALRRLRDLLDPSMNPKERHTYFARRLVGFELEPFGIEVAKSSLMLADFPNPNGWKIVPEDVFGSPSESPKFFSAIKNAKIVLCNPPFENFTESEQLEYDLAFTQKPAEVLSRVLDCLEPNGIVGFVLPHQILDGRAYKNLRKELSRRFSELEIVHLPEGIFRFARFPSAILLGKSPPGNDRVSVRFSEVKDAGQFLQDGAVARTEVVSKTPEEAVAALAVPQLKNLWEFLSKHQKLSGFVEKVARGVEWKEGLCREQYSSSTPKPGFVPGYLTSEEMMCFQAPEFVYLNKKKELRRRNAWDYPWKASKVICNAVRKSSKGPWRISACALDLNIICSQNFMVFWPNEGVSGRFLSAILNGPVACAYATTHERWKHITKSVIEELPMPDMAPDRIAAIDSLVEQYERLAALKRDFPFNKHPSESDLRELLKRIDREVLASYDIPSPLLSELVEFFRGHDGRPVPFSYSIDTILEPDVEKSPDELAKESSNAWETLKLAIDEDRLSDRKFFQ